MVIMNSIDEKNRLNIQGLGINSNQYVYMVDNDEQMMLILKREFEESGNNGAGNEEATIEEFITGKVHNLLERITGKGPLSVREIVFFNYAAMGK
jgi:hypothetical protein